MAGQVVRPETVLARFGPPRWILAISFLGLILFTLTAIAALLRLEAPMDEMGVIRRVALWAAIVFCPAYAVDTAIRFMRHTPTLVATEAGLVFRTILGFTPPIPWAEVEAIAPVVTGKKLYLAIYLADPVTSLGRLGGWTRLFLVRSHGAGEANIVFRRVSLGTNPAEAARVLEEMREARAR
jgi:hypothetical protein